MRIEVLMAVSNGLWSNGMDDMFIVQLVIIAKKHCPIFSLH